jgi:hypothetical protein
MNPIHKFKLCFSRRFILILSSNLRGLQSSLFPWGFPTKMLNAFLISPCMLHAPPISLPLFDCASNICWGSSSWNCSPVTLKFSPLRCKCSRKHPISRHPQSVFFPFRDSEVAVNEIGFPRVKAKVYTLKSETRVSRLKSLKVRRLCAFWLVSFSFVHDLYFWFSSV